MKLSFGWMRLLAALVLVLGIACSDSDDGAEESDDGAAGAPSPNAGDDMQGGDTGNQGGDTGMPGGDTGMGDPGAMDPLMNLPEPPTCDSTIPTTATCGGTACAGGGMFAQFTCTVPCCADGDVCGTRTAVEGEVTDCVAGAVEDPSCPGYSGDLMGMAIELPGCCTDDGVCGAISSLSNSCITSSMILADLAPGGACGDGGGDADGGI